jgi:hypothetical protein
MNREDREVTTRYGLCSGVAADGAQVNQERATEVRSEATVPQSYDPTPFPFPPGERSEWRGVLAHRTPEAQGTGL